MASHSVAKSKFAFVTGSLASKFFVETMLFGYRRAMDLTLKPKILEIVKTNEEFLEANGSELTDPIWAIFGEAVIAIKNCLTPVLEANNNKDITLLLMCCNALSDSFSAFLSVQQGFVRPPAVVMRGVVENLAAAVTFFEDDQAYSDFKADKYDLPRAITPSKKHFPELAKHYGILTNSFTHETYQSLGRSLAKPKGIECIPKLSIEKGLVPQGVLLSTIAMVVHNIGQITEFCCICYLAEPTFWERVSTEELKMKTTEGRKLVMLLAEKLKEMLPKSTKE